MSTPFDNIFSGFMEHFSRHCASLGESSDVWREFEHNENTSASTLFCEVMPSPVRYDIPALEAIADELETLWEEGLCDDAPASIVVDFSHNIARHEFRLAVLLEIVSSQTGRTLRDVWSLNISENDAPETVNLAEAAYAAYQTLTNFE